MSIKYKVKLGREKMSKITKKRRMVLLAGIIIALVLPISGVQAAESVQAKPTNSSVIVNESKVAFEAYNINGNNYFKLRDLAQALNGSGKKFDVTWDASKNAINLLTNHSYSPVGGELSTTGSTSVKAASLTTSKVYIDGKEAPLTAYNIDGFNYFKLRDMGSAVNFGVAFDGTANSIIVDTASGYKAGAVIVTMAGFKFSPAVITIHKGDTVIWKNTDAAGHDVSGKNFASPTLNKGDKFSFTFNEAGSFDYICKFHNGMNGKLIVE